MPARRKAADPATAVTYVRVSTEEQADSGLGLDDQRGKVLAECAKRELRIVGQYADEGISAKRMDNRPGLLAALEVLDGGQAAHLVVAKLDRLSRSVHDFTGMVDRAERRGWNLTILDMDLDTSTAGGEMMANMLAVFAQYERKLIGERTKAALQVKKAAGAQLGRPDRAPFPVVWRCCTQRAGGASLREIAGCLNRDAVPTSQGGQCWHASSIAAMLRRPDAQEALRVAGVPA